VSDEPEVIAKLRYLHAATVDWLTTECATTGVTISPILAAYDAIVAERDAAIAECHEQARLNGMGSEREARIMAERDAAVRELEETRKREALSDAIVDECDSDITKLVQERASLRAERDAAVRERDAARDKNVQLHALVKKYKNKATKQSQKQKKNYKLAKYADESNATLRARLAACERDLLAWRVWGDKAASGHPDAPMASLDHEVRAVIGNKYGMYTITDVSSETQEGA
jgi:hypothetical protein